MQVTSILRYARISPQKCRLVADVVRGKPVGNAIATLKFMPKKGAELVRKLLESAVANAENRSNDVDVDQLIVTEAYVNEGPRQKRVRPAPMGRAYRYQRRTSHMVVKVAEKGTK